MNTNNNSNNKMKKNIPFFVYGTLMKNFRNHNHVFKIIKNIEIKKAELEQASLYHFEIGFPGAYASKGINQTIKGELIFLDKINEETYDNLIHNLDYLEGFTEEKKPDFDYVRELTQIKVSNEGRSDSYFIEAWVYWCKLDLNVYENFKIEDGDWRKFMENKSNFDLLSIKEDDSGPPKDY